MQLKRVHWDILDHTINRAAGGRYCGTSPVMLELCEAGLMKSAGRVQWCPDEYFTVTSYGRQVHGEVLRKERELDDAAAAQTRGLR
jgi:hypothetical protein